MVCVFMRHDHSVQAFRINLPQAQAPFNVHSGQAGIDQHGRIVMTNIDDVSLAATGQYANSSHWFLVYQP